MLTVFYFLNIGEFAFSNEPNGFSNVMLSYFLILELFDWFYC